MWEKIKSVLAVFGAVITITFCTFVLVFLRRRDSDERGSTGIDERDSAIQDGITDCEDGVADCSERLERCSDTVSRCEEHLHRAEEILRNAIRRSQERESDTQDVADDNGDR